MILRPDTSTSTTPIKYRDLDALNLSMGGRGLRKPSLLGMNFTNVAKLEARVAFREFEGEWSL
jgi:hypothetical protein